MFLKRYGWTKKQQKKPGKYLPYEHPRMQAVRDGVRWYVEKQGVHPRLILNFDHVWAMRSHPSLKQLHKPPAAAGVEKDPFSNNPGRRKERVRISGILGVEQAPVFRTIAGGEGRRGVLVAEKPLMGNAVDEFQPAKQARIDEFNSMRLPRTAVSLTWIDGTRGPLYVALGTGQCKDKKDQEAIKELNETYAGEILIECTGNASHFFTGEVTLKYFQNFLPLAIRQKRTALGLGTDSKVLILCDAFGGLKSKTIQTGLDQMCDQLNCVIIDRGDGAPQMPGGTDRNRV